MRAVSAACLPGGVGGVPVESGNTADRGEREVAGCPGDAGGVPLGSENTADRGDNEAGEWLREAACVEPPLDNTCGVVAGEWKY